jgi:hypothetical protein
MITPAEPPAIHKRIIPIIIHTLLRTFLLESLEKCLPVNKRTKPPISPVKNSPITIDAIIANTISAKIITKMNNPPKTLFLLN